jgi:hypothetical protein
MRYLHGEMAIGLFNPASTIERIISGGQTGAINQQVIGSGAIAGSRYNRLCFSILCRRILKLKTIICSACPLLGHPYGLGMVKIPRDRQISNS